MLGSENQDLEGEGPVQGHEWWQSQAGPPCSDAAPHPRVTAKSGDRDPQGLAMCFALRRDAPHVEETFSDRSCSLTGCFLSSALREMQTEQKR